jgi:hypothetical protein
VCQAATNSSPRVSGKNSTATTASR